MFKRLFWLVLGMGFGFGTSFWVTRFVRAAVSNYSPERVSENLAESCGRRPDAFSSRAIAAYV